MVELQSQQKPSNWWYLLPIFFGIFGGLIMFFVLRNKEQKMVRNGLALGIILEAIHIASMFVLGIFPNISF